jgi:hypothetical protein
MYPAYVNRHAENAVDVARKIVFDHKIATQVGHATCGCWLQLMSYLSSPVVLQQLDFKHLLVDLVVSAM